MGKMTKWMDTFTIQLMRVARWHIPILMLLIVQEVLLRYVFNRPTIWGGDLATMISALGRMVGIGYATLLNSHIIMDLFTHNLPFRRAMILRLFTNLVFILPLLSALIYVTFKRSLRVFALGEHIYSLWSPQLWPVVGGLVIFYSITLLQYLSETTKAIISIKKGSDEWIKAR